MKRKTASLAVAAAMVGGVLGNAGTSSAYPSAVNAWGSGQYTKAYYAAGTGWVKAKGRCQSSSGQSNWWVYGNWETIYVTSTSTPCSFFQQWALYDLM